MGNRPSSIQSLVLIPPRTEARDRYLETHQSGTSLPFSPLIAQGRRSSRSCNYPTLGSAAPSSQTIPAAVGSLDRNPSPLRFLPLAQRVIDRQRCLSITLNTAGQCGASFE